MTIDGGIRMPSVPALQMMPAANSFEYPARTMPVMTIEPTATTEAGAQVADAGVGEANHAARNTTRRHERAGQDEERDREQRELRRGLVELQRLRRHRLVAEEQDRQQRRESERHGNRHVDRHEHEQCDEQERDRHRSRASCAPGGCGSISTCSRIAAASSPSRCASLPVTMRHRTCAKRIASSAKPSGNAACGIHTGIGRSCASVPIPCIVVTYRQLPTNAMTAYAMQPSAAVAPTIRATRRGSTLTSASTPMCDPTRTPYAMPRKISQANRNVTSSSAQTKL